MKRYAKIGPDNKVVTTQMWGTLPSPGMWVESETAIPGDTWDGTIFTSPPAPAPTAEAARRGTISTDSGRAQLAQRLRTATPQQIRDHVNASVTDLPSAKAMLANILILIALDARDGS